MITPDQIARVQDSFAAVVSITDEAAMRFYGRLFTLAPETRALFKHDMREQARKLFLTLATVVEALDRLDTIVPTARELAIRHVRYGVQPIHYRIVGAALIETLRGALGEEFDCATEDAWETAYGILAEVMLAADAEARAA